MDYKDSTVQLPEDFLDIFINNLIDEKSKGGGKGDLVVGWTSVQILLPTHLYMANWSSPY